MRPTVAAGLSAVLALGATLAAVVAVSADGRPPADTRPPEEILAAVRRRLTGTGAPALRYVLEGEVRVELPGPDQAASPAPPGTAGRLVQQLEDLTGRNLDHPDRLELALRGGGTAIAADRDRGRIDYALRAPVEVRGTLDVVTAGDRAYIRTGETGGWVAMPADQRGFTLAGVTIPIRVPDLLGLLQQVAGPLTDLGAREVAGTRVRGLRFGTGDVGVDLWVAASGDLVRELTWRHAPGRDGDAGPVRVTANVTLRLRGTDTAVSIGHPPAAEPLAALPPERRPPFPVRAG